MSRVTVRQRQPRYPSDVRVSVGCLEPSAPHEGTELTTGELLEIHEFGKGHVPERSVVRAWFDLHRAEAEAKALELMTTHGPARGAELFAVWAAASMRNRITEGIDPPLAPETIARRLARTPSRKKAANTKFKGTQGPTGNLTFTPLIDRGILKSSIVGDVEVTP